MFLYQPHILLLL